MERGPAIDLLQAQMCVKLHLLWCERASVVRETTSVVRPVLEAAVNTFLACLCAVCLFPDSHVVFLLSIRCCMLAGS